MLGDSEALGKAELMLAVVEAGRTLAYAPIGQSLHPYRALQDAVTALDAAATPAGEENLTLRVDAVDRVHTVPPSPANRADYRLKATKAVLAERERELLELKGPCVRCRLHYAHSGPCAPEPQQAGQPTPCDECETSCRTHRENPTADTAEPAGDAGGEVDWIMAEMLAYGDGRANEMVESECGSPIEAERIRSSADVRYRAIRQAVTVLVARRDQGRAEVGQLAVNQKRVAASTYQAASGLHERHIRCLAERDEARAELDEALGRLNAALVRSELMRPVVEAARKVRLAWGAYCASPDAVPGEWGDGIDQADAVLHEALNALDATTDLTGRGDMREGNGCG